MEIAIKLSDWEQQPDEVLSRIVKAQRTETPWEQVRPKQISYRASADVECVLKWPRAEMITVAAAIVSQPALVGLDRRFREQADKWQSETAFLSSTPMRVMHDSYQTIMAMGPDVIPILLLDLQKTHRHWFWALRHLTNVDPVLERDKGNIDKMIDSWITWGRKEGKI
jgi:hypothetical protein